VLIVSGRIRDEDIAEVRDRVRIDEVVGEQVTLRPAGGGSLKGLCPFHDERSPSFHVTPSRGLYHCFGCGEGGDAITFLQRTEQLSFAEAVEKLADMAGVRLRVDEDGPGAGQQRAARETRTRLVKANQAAADFYAESLLGEEGGAGRDFLTARGFGARSAEHFGVGYAPKGGEALVGALTDQGFVVPELVSAGLVVQGGRGPYDRFRGRLLWPIKDVTGDVVGFGARRLYDDDRVEAKYLNTPETAIYKKSHVLYGLDLAKREMARRSQAVVVEGYTDVMACHLAGVPTAVATCGTAFGADHARVIRRMLMDSDAFRGEVIFTFDGDAAGRKAALRAFDNDQSFVAQTFVAVEPTGKDPCELRQEDGDEAVRDLLARRQPLFEFVIRSTLADYDLDTAEGRTHALTRAVPVVAGIRDSALRDEYARRLAGWVGSSDESEVLRRVRQHSGHSSKGARGNLPASRPSAPATAQREGKASSRGAGEAEQAEITVLTHGDVDPVALSVQREALKAALQRPALVGPVLDALPIDVFTSPVYAAVAQGLAAAGGVSSQTGGAVWVDRVRSALAHDTLRSLVTELAVEPLSTEDQRTEEYVSSVVLRLREMGVSRQLAGVKGRLQRTDPEADAAAYNTLFGELMGLERLRRELRERIVGGD
jgi:DNA primase